MKPVTQPMTVNAMVRPMAWNSSPRVSGRKKVMSWLKRRSIR